MREIKFKAKKIDGGGWVQGCHCELAGRKYIIPDYSQFRNIHDADIENSFTEIIPETVCQFTGLKDKNGVKIFEGDILQKEEIIYGDDEDTISITTDVATMERFPRYWLKNESFGYEGEDLESPCDWEVIGNIHDKAQQKQALIDMMRGDEELGLYDDNSKKNH